MTIQWNILNQISQIKSKTSVLKLSLCDYSDTYIFVKGTISIKAEARNNPNNGDKEVVFKNFAPVTDSISEINNTPIYNVKGIDVVMSMCKLKEYSNNYSKDQEVYANTVEMSQF